MRYFDYLAFLTTKQEEINEISKINNLLLKYVYF